MGEWDHINSAPKFTRVATGGAGVWAVDSNNHIHYRYRYIPLLDLFKDRDVH